MLFLSHLSELLLVGIGSAGIGTCSNEWLSRFQRAGPSTSLNEWVALRSPYSVKKILPQIFSDFKRRLTKQDEKRETGGQQVFRFLFLFNLKVFASRFYADSNWDLLKLDKLMMIKITSATNMIRAAIKPPTPN